jgi:hypothetical protein
MGFMADPHSRYGASVEGILSGPEEVNVCSVLDCQLKVYVSSSRNS